MKIVLARPKLVIARTMPTSFFHIHAHSKFSYNDGMPTPTEMVTTAHEWGQSGIGLTDHGNMAGAVELYQAGSKAGIAPYVGSEMYFVRSREDKKAKRYHLGLLAYTTQGYANMVHISTASHTRENFHHKPLIDWVDLAQFKENGWLDGVLITTGCFFGIVVQTLINEGQEAATYAVAKLSKMGRTVVELQAHNIDQKDMTECDIASALFEISQQLGLELCITQDSHYAKLSDRGAHDALKRVGSFGDNPDEVVFPGDGFHLCDAGWVKRHHLDRHWAASESFYAALRAEHSLTISCLDHYHYAIPRTADDPDGVLQGLCSASLLERNLPRPYLDKLNEEMSIILDTGMAGYLLLVKECTDWLREHKVLFQARGSAAGSLVCWLCGITPLDPIHYKLLFERFISRDRTKPPDVDLDIEDQRREEFLDWLATRFASSQIGTWSKYSVDALGKGSLIVAYKKIARMNGVPTEELNEIKAITDIPEPHRSAMLELSERKLYKGVGTNAAGIIVAPSKGLLSGLIPMMGIPSSGSFKTVSQYHKNDVEALGIVKLDAMGLKTLSHLRRSSELLGNIYGDELEDIPLDDTATFTMIRNGDTQGVFQLEGGTARRGCRELKVRSLKDIIVIMALYRPAVMKVDPTTGFSAKDLYIARRQGRERPPERHELLRVLLKETYGLFVFQEQVISILRMIGFTPDDLTEFLKAVKASNSDIGDAGVVIAGYEQMLREMALAHHMISTDIDFIWDGIKGFASYSFNRSHASVYGVTAYRCAYLKLHHPLEFATGLLQTDEGSEGETQAISTVRSMGIRIGRPHVNVSGYSYSLDTRMKTVRRGLLSIKGVGPGCAAELAQHAPYASIADIISRCDARKVTGGKSYAKAGELNGVLGMLSESGALQDLDKRVVV